MHSSRRATIAVLLFIAASLLPHAAVQAEAPGNEHFQRTWARTDKPVADGQVSRTWMWGPEGFTGEVQEAYAESPGAFRTVQYFDKSRMEITSDPNVSPDSVWYVTNGLLVAEMMSGNMQVGTATYEQRSPARVNVAGDADDSRGITYEFFGFLADQTALAEGTAINQVLTPGSAGNLYMYNDQLLEFGVTAAHYVPETQHTVASPFWDFMNSSGTVYDAGAWSNAPLFQNPYYATGLPVTEAYWALVKVGGIDRDVLIQCFERRCLTYTPSNELAWRVEAGNVGQHYYSWRYGPVDQVEYEPWIYGTSAFDIGAHVLAEADNRGDHCDISEPRASVLLELSCTHSTPDVIYDYFVTVYGDNPSYVKHVYAMFSLFRGDPAYTDQIAADVLGDIAAITYLEAQPEMMRSATSESIGEYGSLQVNSATFVLNDPFYYGTGSINDRMRTLDIWATGYIE